VTLAFVPAATLVLSSSSEMNERLARFLVPAALSLCALPLSAAGDTTAAAPASASASVSASASAPASAPASASVSASASVAPPPNAPIVLSPGVAAEPAAPAAKKPATPPPEVEQPRGAWFGWQIIAADLIIAGTTAALVSSQPESRHLPIVIGGSALFIGTAPLIHLANGSGRAFDSLLVHSISLAAGVALGIIVIEGFAGCGPQHPCELERIDFAAIGAAVGAVFAPVYDAAFLAFRKAPPKSVSVRPLVRTSADGALFGFSVTL